MKNMKKWFERSKIIVFLTLVIALLGVGATVAMFTDTEAATNTVSIGRNDIEIGETPGVLKKENITVTNNGSIPVYVRARVDVPTGLKFIDADGTEKELTVAYDPKEVPEGWTKDPVDGYLYYNSVLAVKETKVLYNSVSFKINGVDPTAAQKELIVSQLGDFMDITIYTESVQSAGLPENVDTAKEAFDYLASLKN